MRNGEQVFSFFHGINILREQDLRVLADYLANPTLNDGKVFEKAAGLEAHQVSRIRAMSRSAPPKTLFHQRAAHPPQPSKLLSLLNQTIG